MSERSTDLIEHAKGILLSHAEELRDEVLANPPTREERLGGYPTRESLKATAQSVLEAQNALAGRNSGKPMKLLAVGMTTAELAERFKRGDLETYADCAGNTVIRTKEAGDAHRAQVAAERELRRDEQIRHARLSHTIDRTPGRFEPADPIHVPRPDPDEQYEDYRSERDE